jgi:hypothetical protein
LENSRFFSSGADATEMLVSLLGSLPQRHRLSIQSASTRSAIDSSSLLIHKHGRLGWAKIVLSGSGDLPMVRAHCTVFGAAGNRFACKAHEKRTTTWIAGGTKK